MSVPDGQQQRCPAGIIRRIHFGAPDQEYGGDFLIAGFSGGMQGGPAVLIGGVQVDIHLEEPLHSGGITAFGHIEKTLFLSCLFRILDSGGIVGTGIPAAGGPDGQGQK